jgi:hypothetical protein
VKTVTVLNWTFSFLNTVILYLAALYTSGVTLHGQLFRRFSPVEQAARAGVKHLLESYHYVHKQKSVDAMRRDGVKVFLDSGAFSAFTQGVEIDIVGYCDYIKRNQDIILVASVLDGIGDPLKTWQNQEIMQSHGVNPLPCFHYGEDERYLEHYIANYEYITLGGMVPINKQQLQLWLDRIWSRYLTDKDGMPIRKVHGFGLTRVGLMQRYPWYSVDSSSWVQNARTGGIMIPGIGAVFVSHDSPARHEEGRHFNTFPQLEQSRIRHEIERRGFSLERCQETYLARWTFNMLTYGELTDPDAIPKPFISTQVELF